MGTATAYETKTHLADLLRRVQRGESITITKHGVPVAKLVPVEGYGTKDVREAIEALLEFRKVNKLRGVTIKEMIEEGRN
jgi:prevent-host-death family protein